MHPQEVTAPGLGHLDPLEDPVSTSPKLGQRIKSAASKVAHTLHLPGAGHGPHSPGAGLPAVEHHRVAVEHVAAETEAQWAAQQVKQQPGELGGGGRVSTGGVAAPATPVREPGDAAASTGRPAATAAAGPTATEGAHKEASFAFPATTTAPDIDTPFSSPSTGSPAAGESPLHSHEGSLTSIERSTESHDIYVEELEPLVAGTGVKRAGKKEKNEDEEHTDAGPSPWGLRRTEKETGEILPEQQPAEASAEPPWTHDTGRGVLGAAAAAPGTPQARAPSTMPPPLLPSAEEVEEAMAEEPEEYEGKAAAAGLRGTAAASKPAETEEEYAEAGSKIAMGSGQMTKPFESPSGKVVIPPVEVPEGLAVPRRRDAGRALVSSVVGWIGDNPLLAALLTLGIAGLGSAGWAVLAAATPPPFREFGPALLVSGAVALVASVLAWLLRTGGVVSCSGPLPLAVPEEGVAAAEEAMAAGATSEPVSKESIEDLKGGGGGGVASGSGKGKGLLTQVEHMAEDAAEVFMEKIDPGMEMAGEVTQEPEVEGGGGGAVARGGNAEPAVPYTDPGGYSSDSDVPGAVVEGVHPIKKKRPFHPPEIGPSVGQV